MRFLYSYRDKDGNWREGEVSSSCRDQAYKDLKCRGIKPIKVFPAPGFVNSLLGLGKRWAAILVLAIAALMLSVFLVRSMEANREVAGEELLAERSQLYGDPVVINEISDGGWLGTFDDPASRWLAQHAIPGAECPCGQGEKYWGIPGWRQEIAKRLLAARHEICQPTPEDLAEVVEIKKMVNGLKREMNTYIDAGGNVETYMRRLDIRQHAEHGIFERVRNELSRTPDLSLWRKRNLELRSMGLPLVEPFGIMRKGLNLEAGKILEDLSLTE